MRATKAGCPRASGSGHLHRRCRPPSSGHHGISWVRDRQATERCCGSAAADRVRNALSSARPTRVNGFPSEPVGGRRNSRAREPPPPTAVYPDRSGGDRCHRRTRRFECARIATCASPTGSCMMSRALQLAIALARTWTRVYTAWTPPDLCQGRRAEIESDLWEFQQERVAGRTLHPAVHVLVRLVLGIPDDLRWCAANPSIRVRRVRRQTAVVTVVLLLAALWVFESMRPADLPRPPAAPFQFTMTPPPSPPPPISPPRLR